MEVKCHQCESRLSVADEKLPAGKITTFRCPKCKARVTIDLRPPSESGQEEAGLSSWGVDEDSPQQGAGARDVMAESYDASEKPFDFLEEEGKTALLCEDDPERRAAIKEVLDVKEYHVTVPEGIRDALRKMKYHVYDLILVNERFDGSDPDANGVLIYLERMSMDVRRDIYLAMISERFQTMDYMSAFLKSVNIIINPEDLGSLDQILTRGINERDLFYGVFKESARKLGKT
jgi:CheY-like chemotaxis protein